MELTSQVIKSILSKYYPEPHIEGTSVCDGGQISNVVEINCSQPRADFILKIYPDQFHWKMEKEVFVYQLLSGNVSIPSPKILLFDDSRTLLSRNYVLMDKLDGVVLSKVSAELEPKQLRDIYRQAGEVLRVIHLISFRNFGYISNGIADPHPDNNSYMTDQFQKKLAEFRTLGGNEATYDAVHRFLSSNSNLLRECRNAVLCHNDYYEGNFLVTQINGAWKLSGVIDYENALAGDPLLDIAKTFYYAIHNDPNKGGGFLEGYGQLPDQWRQRLHIYKIYHALELWNWFASIGNADPLANIEADLITLSKQTVDTFQAL